MNNLTFVLEINKCNSNDLWNIDEIKVESVQKHLKKLQKRYKKTVGGMTSAGKGKM